MARKRIQLIVGGAIALVAIVFGVIQYRDFVQSTPVQPTVSDGKVDIVSPGNYQEVGLHEPLLIAAIAVGPNAFTEAELWIDGLRLGQITNDDPSATQYKVNFWWAPEKPGPHSLVVRAFDNGGGSISSAPLLIIASGLTSDEDNPQELGSSVFPAVETSDNDFSNLDTPTNAVPASDWSPNPVQLIASIVNQDPPMAPIIQAKAGNCAASLSIKVQSDNEQGFRVYRSSVANPGWIQVGLLAAQSDSEWIAFEDANISGHYVYYVSAFNANGNSSSNFQYVQVDPSSCGPSANQFPVYNISFSSLTPKVPVENMYCYKSIGELGLERYPVEGFIPVSNEGFDLSEEVAKVVLNSGNGDQVNPEAIKVFLHCWGWNGGSLIDLGSLSTFFDPSGPSENSFDLSQLAGALKFSVGSINDFPGNLPKLELTGNGLFQFLDDPDLLDSLDLEFPVYTSDQMPIIQAWFTTDPYVCDAHVEKEAVNFNSVHSYSCAPLPGYNWGPDGAAPQQYLVWTTLDNTCPGMNTKECIPLSTWIDFAAHRGYEGEWGFQWVFGYDGGYSNSWQRTVTRLECEGEGSDSIRVKMRVWDPINQVAIDSIPSNSIIYLCGHKIGESVEMEVTFNAIAFSDLDDGDNVGCVGEGSCDDIEVYGRFAAAPGGWTQAGGTTDIALKCGNPEQGAPGAGAPYCLKVFGNAYYSLSGIPMCLWPTANQKCSPYHSWATLNNTVTVELKDNQSLTLFSNIFDHDAGSADDKACYGGINVGPRSLFEWAATSNESHDIVLSHDDGNCAVNVILNAK